MQVLGPLCDGCPQQSVGELFIEPDGSGQNGMLFVGDSPWKDEVSKERNFSGPAGFLYEKWLGLLGEKRENCTTANTMWCRPAKLNLTDHPEKNPDIYTSLQHCRPYLDRIVHERKPKVIVPMGNVALRRVVGISGIEANHGYVHDSVWGIPAVSTFHTSFVMRGKHKFTPIVIGALRRAREIAQGSYKPTPTTVIEDPNIDDLKTYVGGFPVDLDEITIDIETLESSTMEEEEAEKGGVSFQIVRASFSLEGNVGVSFPWLEPYISFFRSLMARTEMAWEWSSKHFDSQRLQAQGIFPRNCWASSMLAFHFWQSDLPKSLGFVAPLVYAGPPWKNLNRERPAFYSGMDSLVAHLILRQVRHKLRDEGRWHVFERHCIELDRILVEAGNKGFRVDPEVQQRFLTRIRGELDEGLSLLDEKVPVAVKPVKRWIRPPKDITNVVTEVVECPPCKACKNKGTKTMYHKVLPFNPESPLQVKKLIRHLGLKVPIDRRLGGETTGQKHLKRFAQKSDIFSLLLECKERETLLSTYSWKLDGDGRVRTNFGFEPSSWRKNSYSVNTQQIPKHSDLAQEFRRMIVADPGHTFLTLDSESIEAVLTGYFAGSSQYIRLAKAGVHGWLASCKAGTLIPIDLPFDELRSRCQESKRNDGKLYNMCKRVVYLSNYLGSHKLIFEEYPDDFSSLLEARNLQELYFNTEPGKDIKHWQKKVMELAHKEHLLRSPFGYWHYFYDVKAFDPRSKTWGQGTDARRAVAFLPQATASAIQTEAILWLKDNHSWVLPFLRLIIHDELVFHVPDEEDTIWKASIAVREAMTQPWLKLDGLSIGVSCKFGSNLGERVPDNPDGLREIGR